MASGHGSPSQILGRVQSKPDKTKNMMSDTTPTGLRKGPLLKCTSCCWTINRRAYAYTVAGRNYCALQETIGQEKGGDRHAIHTYVLASNGVDSFPYDEIDPLERTFCANGDLPFVPNRSFFDQFWKNSVLVCQPSAVIDERLCWILQPFTIFLHFLSVKENAKTRSAVTTDQQVGNVCYWRM